MIMHDDEIGLGENFVITDDRKIPLSCAMSFSIHLSPTRVAMSKTHAEGQLPS